MLLERKPTHLQAVGEKWEFPRVEDKRMHKNRSVSIVLRAGTNFRSDLCMSNGREASPHRLFHCSRDRLRCTPREAHRCQHN